LGMGKGFEDQLSSLDRLEMGHLSVYYSPGFLSEAKAVGGVADEAYGYLGGFFGECPEIVLMVLDEGDWEKQAPGSPYGNPFVPDKRVLYGVRPPENWREPLTMLTGWAPADVRRELAEASGLGSATVGEAFDRLFTLGFFAATVAHEMAHPFLGLNLVLPQPVESAYALKLDAFWMGEFLPWYAMYSFLEARDRPLCSRWKALMRCAFEGGRGRVRYRDLSEMGARYREMTGSCIENLFWYHAKLFVMSADLYNLHGEGFLSGAIDELRLSERLLVDRLERSFGVESWLREWRSA